MNNSPLILVVEDDAAVQSLMAMALEMQGYRYHLARSGAEALLEAATTIAVARGCETDEMLRLTRENSEALLG